MPQFFFHLRTAQGLDVDDVGTPFADLDLAYLDVCRAIPEMVTGLLRDGHDPLRCAFEITDRQGQLVIEVPFAERLAKPAPRPLATVPVPDGWAVLDRIFNSAVSARAEAAELRRSIRETRLRLAQAAQPSGTPFLDYVERVYDLRYANAGR